MFFQIGEFFKDNEYFVIPALAAVLVSCIFAFVLLAIIVAIIVIMERASKEIMAQEILLIEDDDAIRTALKYALEDSGYQTLEAESMEADKNYWEEMGRRTVFSFDVGAVIDGPPQIDYNPRDYRVMLCVPMETYYAVAEHFQTEYAAASYRTYLLLKTSGADDLLQGYCL